MPGPRVDPAVYGLFWASTLPGNSGDGLVRTTAGQLAHRVVVALGIQNETQKRPPYEAIVLYPSFLTPALLEEGDKVELLLLAPSKPELTPDLVNRHLKVAPGLDPGRWATQRVLTADAARDIQVAKVEPEGGILSTDSGFHGIVDSRFDDDLDAWHKERSEAKATSERRKLDACYRVAFPASCLANAVGPPSVPKAPRQPPEDAARQGQAPWKADDPHDSLVRSVLLRKNGKRLGGREGPGAPAEGGIGLHAFPVANGRLDLGQPDLDQPVVAHHLVFLYRKGELGHASFGHFSDLHVNARQHVLALSPARVIEETGGPTGAGSGKVGDLLTVYSTNVLAIMEALGDEADVLLAGGDLVDHVRNVVTRPASAHPTAKQVWDVVGLEKKQAAENYQPFVDHLSFYSMALHVCAEKRRPIFVVTGNHDGYLEPYGISPRVSGQRANPGIPADHNLTFLEAMLAFGPTYGSVRPMKALSLHKHLFEWFHAVYTPFRDWAVKLPEQALVGLAWGDDEEKLASFVSGQGEGFGGSHLPRAIESLGSQQVKLVDKALDWHRTGVLTTHFTFVSYHEKIANVPEDQAVQGAGPRAGFVRAEGRFGDHDLGTFVNNRPALYGRVHDGRFKLVFTGHSHRKGLYRLAGAGKVEAGLPARTSGYVAAAGSILVAGALPQTITYPTEMYSLVQPWGEGRPLPPAFHKDAAIVVSDSAGPLPRLNQHGEFASWGHDRPAGTLATVDRKSGKLTGVKAVQAATPGTQPRLAVALDFLQVEAERGIVRINSSEWFWTEFFDEKDHHLRFTFHEAFFNEPVGLVSVDLHVMLAKGRPWSVLSLGGAQRSASGGKLVITFPVPRQHNAAYGDWLKAVKVPRFLSLRFVSFGKMLPVPYRTDAEGAVWRFPVKCKMPTSTTLMHYEIEPQPEDPELALRQEYFEGNYKA